MRCGPPIRAILGALFVLTAQPAAGAERDPLAGLSIGKSCRELLEKHLYPSGAQLILGHLYFARDPATGRTACGWSSSSPYTAFAACHRTTTKNEINAPCLPLVKDSEVVARSHAEAKRQAGDDTWELTMATDPMRCGQEPGNRAYWLEHGFCDMKRHGPQRAHGVIIWNHGIAKTMVQHTTPPALALRLLQARGWDVIKLNRHNLGEDSQSYRRAEERVMEEVKAQRAHGYKKIVVAGQSFGGKVALEVGTTSSDIFATLAMAPGMEETVGNSRIQAPTDQRLRRSRVERVAVVFPAHDELFGNPERGRTAGPILAERGRPYLFFDETTELRGHSGGTSGNFALRYGSCLADFLTLPHVPDGRFPCPANGSGWAVARELLPRPPRYLKILSRQDEVPPAIAGAAGLWYGLLGESIVAWALVDAGKPGPNILFTWVTRTSRSGGVYRATVDGDRIGGVLPNQATLVARPLDGARLAVTWTPREAESNFSLYAGRNVPLSGELSRVPLAP